MPANKKYLTKSPFQRFMKITAGFVGGYAVMISAHLALTSVFNKDAVVATAFFSGYILWAILLLCAFLARNAWKIWLIYLALAAVFVLLYLFNR